MTTDWAHSVCADLVEFPLRPRGHERLKSGYTLCKLGEYHLEQRSAADAESTKPDVFIGYLKNVEF